MPDSHPKRTTITIAPQLQTQLAHISQQLGKSIEEIADEALRTHLDALGARALDKELSAYTQLYPQLHQRYLHQVVAIYEGSVIDSDPDFETLFLRVHQKFGDRTVLIRRVEDTPQEEYRFRSPRIDQAL